MTHIDYNGKRINKPKEIWVDEKRFDIPLQIEEELCRQVNKGLWKDEIEEVEIIQKFIRRAELE